jgi:rubrerythrin
MATDQCPTCDHIAAMFAHQIAAGDVFRCSNCGRTVAAAPPAPPAPPAAPPAAGP